MLNYRETKLQELRAWHSNTQLQCTSCAAQETLGDQMEGKSHVSDAIAKEVSSALVMTALKKGTLDNVTVLVLLLRWD